MPEATFHFPPDFLWGVATAAHQVEGYNQNNQWWEWEQRPGTIKHNHHSEAACDWWRNAEQDFNLAASMGLKSLRLSVEWSRIEPEPGQFDTAALARYREMLSALRARNIIPMVTLHHFTDPLWFAQRGGWLAPDAIARFTRFVEEVVTRLGDLVNLWCTINEPNVYAYMGYVAGVFPPGEHDLIKATAVLRALLRAHAAAYRTLHRLQPEAQVGLAHNLRFFDPAHPNRPQDQLIARLLDTTYNESVLTPLASGFWRLPTGWGPAWGLRNTLDWIGINYYTRSEIAFDWHARETLFGREMPNPQAEPLDGGYGQLYPKGMARAVARIARRFRKPIYITENGIPDADDDQRPRALILHLHQLWRIMQENFPVRGYYHWTLVDNFEWAEGWTLRFGLVEMDPYTGERAMRPSANLYASIVRANAITPELIDAYAPELRSSLLP